MTTSPYNWQAILKHLAARRFAWVGLPTLHRLCVGAAGDRDVVPDERQEAELRAVLDDLVERGLVVQHGRDAAWRRA